ncbi:peptidoglycan editing factor PgeF [Psittacicella hinzii]|uniref:Purine nucleoside phosphorylase n=1 Tax=Psittacicella hinzii TaxID=2028575 RepID=A0A3A1YC50_9GAMM|nr:peptidoglycan editing factor PgeF [Psittacicella hinzii]RIY34789.1 hypothetical protein CKF58_07640 [Psittacicella hinzii]
MSSLDTIIPNWPLKRVKAHVTTRFGGESTNDYFNFNLASHVGDNPEVVQHNRLLLEQKLSLPEQPLWVQQVSGGNVLELPIDNILEQEYLQIQKSEQASVLKSRHADLWKIFEVDALYTNQVNKVCAILTADCIPLLLCDENETEVASVHAGWRGVIAGVVENSIYTFKTFHKYKNAHELYAWIGPAIGPQSFVVGSEVMMEFVEKDRDFAHAFVPYPAEKNKWLGDLPLIVSIILQKLGVNPERIYFSQIDTVTDDRFYSYRRDKVTGRFASLIWLPDEDA